MLIAVKLRFDRDSYFTFCHFLLKPCKTKIDILLKMMPLLASLRCFIERFHTLLGTVVSWFTVLMAVLTFVIVVLRYGFDMGWIALQESVLYLHACVFMLGAAMTFKDDGHVRVDIFYRKMTARRKALVDVLGGVMLLMPVCVFIVATSWQYVIKSWQLLESSQAAGGLPAVFLLKSLILLFAITLFLQALSDIAAKLPIIFNQSTAHSAANGN